MGKYLLRIILFLIICVLTNLRLVGQNTIIQVGVDNAYFPFEYIDVENKPAGFDIDLLQALAKETGLELKITPGDWFAVKDQLEQGQLDMIAGMFYSSDRAAHFDFSMPYIIITHSIFVKKGNKIRSLNELSEDKSIRVVIENSNILQNYLITNGISADRILHVENQLDALSLVEESYNICALLPELQAKYITKKNSLSDIISVGLPIRPREYSFAVTKGDSTLLNNLNKGLTQLQQNGEFNRIFEKWFGKYNPSFSVLEEATSFLGLVGISMVFIAFFIFFFMQYRMKKLRNENKNLHNEIKQSNLVLKDIHLSETLFKRIVEFSPFPIAMIHEDDYFVFANSYFEELFGKQLNNRGSVNSWLKKSIKNEHEQNFIKSQFYHNPIDLVRHAKGNTSIICFTKSGLEKSMQLFFVSLGNGQLLIFFWEELEKAGKYKHKVLNGSIQDEKAPLYLPYFSYVFREPMNVIIGFSEMMKAEDITLNEMKSFAGLIHQNAQRLLQLHKNLGTLVKIDSDELPIKLEFILVSNLISNIHQQFVELITSSDKNLTLELEKLDDSFDDLVVSSDNELLNQTLLNLLRYFTELTKKESMMMGCKLIKKWKIQFFIKLNLEEKEYLLFSEKIDSFQNTLLVDAPFFNSETDLSLFISLSLIKELGSKLLLVREENNITKITFNLPCYSSKDSVAQYKMKRTTKDKYHFDWEGKKILIADDNKISSDYFQIIFKSTKAEIVSANNGQEAYELCRNDPNIDLVIMDWLMPVMDGETSTKLIKQLRPNLPIISITAFALSDEREKILQSGCNAYYPKPVDKNELLNYIHTLFNGTDGESIA